MDFLGKILSAEDLINKKYVDEAIPTNISEIFNDAGYIKGIDKSMVASAVGASGNAGKVLSSTGGDLGWISLPTSLPASDVYAWAKKSSLALADVPDLSSKYLSVNGGTIGGELTINPSSGFGSFNVYNADDTYRLTHIWDGNTARLYNIKSDGSSYGILNLQGTIQINGNTAIHSGNIGYYALKVNPTNINLASDTNVAGYGQTSDGWPVAGPALLLSNSVGNYAMMLSGRNGVLRFNTREAGNLTGWKTIAFTDSNVASAQALTHSNGTVGAVVNSSGNVTIGGSDSAGTGVKLHVDGITKIHHPNALQGVQSLLHLTGTLVGSTAKGKGVAITLGMDSNQYYSKIATIFESQNPDYLRPALAFFTMNNTYVAGSEVERMRIASNGNVGIGTDNPAYKLDVNGTGRFTGAVTMTSTLSVTSGVTSMGFLTNGNYGIWRGSSYTSAMTANDIIFYADNFRFECGSSFVKTLEIQARLVTINGNAIITGDTSTGSDIRFKDIKEHFVFDLETMANAPLFAFTWNDRNDNEVHIGGSAQYWRCVRKELVRGEEFLSMNYTAANYGMCVSLAKKALNHEERIKILEKENEQLKEQIRRINYGN